MFQPFICFHACGNIRKEMCRMTQKKPRGFPWLRGPSVQSVMSLFPSCRTSSKMELVALRSVFIEYSFTHVVWIYFNSFSFGSSSSNLATIRFCSARGGRAKGNSTIFSREMFGCAPPSPNSMNACFEAIK